MAEGQPAARVGIPVSQLEQDLDILTRAETSLDVGRPAPEIYLYLLDFPRHMEWAHTYLTVEATTPGPTGVGSRYLVRKRQDLRWDKRPFATIADREGMDYTSEIAVTALDPERGLSWRSRIVEGSFLTGAEGDWSFVLEHVDDRITRVRLRGRVDGPRELLLGWIDELRARGYPLDVIQRQVDRAMHNLRTILEGRA